jgi:hypothetical protein
MPALSSEQNSNGRNAPLTGVPGKPGTRLAGAQIHQHHHRNHRAIADNQHAPMAHRRPEYKMAKRDKRQQAARHHHPACPAPSPPVEPQHHPRSRHTKRCQNKARQPTPLVPPVRQIAGDNRRQMKHHHHAHQTTRKFDPCWHFHASHYPHLVPQGKAVGLGRI